MRPPGATRDARVSTATLYAHFPSKAELVLTVVRMHRAQARAGLAALNQQVNDPQARLNAYTGYWAQCIRDNSMPICICAMLAAELPAIPSEIAHEVRTYFEELSGWLTAVMALGAERGTFRLKDAPAVEAHAFMATVHGAMLSARAFGHPETFETITQAAIGRLAAPA